MIALSFTSSLNLSMNGGKANLVSAKRRACTEITGWFPLSMFWTWFMMFFCVFRRATFLRGSSDFMLLVFVDDVEPRDGDEWTDEAESQFTESIFAFFFLRLTMVKSSSLSLSTGTASADCRCCWGVRFLSAFRFFPRGRLLDAIVCSSCATFAASCCCGIGAVLSGLSTTGWCTWLLLLAFDGRFVCVGLAWGGNG